MKWFKGKKKERLCMRKERAGYADRYTELGSRVRAAEEELRAVREELMGMAEYREEHQEFLKQLSEELERLDVLKRELWAQGYCESLRYEEGYPDEMLESELGRCEI